VKIH